MIEIIIYNDQKQNAAAVFGVSPRSSFAGTRRNAVAWNAYLIFERYVEHSTITQIADTFQHAHETVNSHDNLQNSHHA